MAVEAELKALAHDPKRLHAALSQRTVGEHSIYTDRYFDYPDRGWTRRGTELRVRIITKERSPTRALLTFKEPAVDEGSGSKPEHETAIGDADVLITVLTALGVEPIIAFEKHCVNYRFTSHGRDLFATVVTVPELAGQTFIELETLADPDDVDAALDVVRSVLRELGSRTATLPTRHTPMRSPPKETPPSNTAIRPVAMICATATINTATTTHETVLDSSQGR